MLPELLVQQSAGKLKADGYDYVGEDLEHLMLLFFTTDDPSTQIPPLISFLASERVLENDLSNVAVGVEEVGVRRVVHPRGFSGTFHWPE